MVYIPSGTLHIGQSDQDVFSTYLQRPKAISISGFFMDDTEIIGTGAENSTEIVTLTKTPVTTTATVRDSVNVTAATSPVIGEAYLYNRDKGFVASFSVSA
jgi:hypothetical protein